MRLVLPSDPITHPVCKVVFQQCKIPTDIERSEESGSQVRGSTGSVDEMSFIIKHSGSCGVIVQDTAALERLLPGLAGSQSTPGNGDAPELALQVVGALPSRLN